MNATPETLALLTRVVVWGALPLGLLLGAVAQATRFCVRGGIADWVSFQGPARLFSWVLSIAVGALLLQSMIGLGVFDATRTLAWNERLLWFSALGGGLLFGIGMMLAPGCPQRCLVKAGSGDLTAWATLVVIAVVAIMTLRGILAVPRVGLFDSVSVTLSRPQDLGSLLGGALGTPAGAVRAVVTLLIVAMTALFAWRVRRQLDAAAWIGGLGVGLVLALAFYLTGRIGFIAEHPETLDAAWLGTQGKRPEGLSFVAPLANAMDLLTLWTDKNTVATFGVMLSLGIVLGSHFSARWRGEYRVESFATARELRHSVVGGALMGFGGVTALGCSVGNGVTGAALLSTGSLLAVVGMVAGTVLVLRWQARVDERAQGAPAARVA
ncbi:YeeE/YedE family protein [Ramlibacter henchirensis]|uniref:YeeE/YedE family protein n=1 Tax=Ramlibacter henchirensis TaxID=204072 RepID=A0A4Z0C801_9BURK|nr:YeeE/YedE family protein [Ramlibacter henchirensis]TFZ07032.1 YeeE/YedE family protein [Ramlibacter henchirensis]